MSEAEIAAYNRGLAATVNVIRAGVHSTAAQSGLWGIQDDDAYIIAAIEKLRLPLTPRNPQ